MKTLREREAELRREAADRLRTASPEELREHGVAVLERLRPSELRLINLLVWWIPGREWLRPFTPSPETIQAAIDCRETPAEKQQYEATRAAIARLFAAEDPRHFHEGMA